MPAEFSPGRAAARMLPANPNPAGNPMNPCDPVTCGRSAARCAALVLAVLLASGCSSLGGPPPEPTFSSVAIVTRGEADVDLEADSTMRNAMVGGGAGALGGGVVGGAGGAVAGLGSGRAVLQLESVELEQHLSDAVSLRVRAAMEIEWGPLEGERRSRSYDYEYLTSERHVDEWLANEGAAFADELDRSIEGIAQDMLRDILAGTTR